MKLSESLRLMTVVLLAGLCAAMTTTQSVVAATEGAGTEQLGKGLALLGAGIAIAVAGLGAGLGMGTASAAIAGAVAERPEIFGKTLLYIVFMEALAIYALVVSFMIIMSLG
jgi:V/A-type H+-transporting ATPase subunit K